MCSCHPCDLGPASCHELFESELHGCELLTVSCVCGTRGATEEDCGRKGGARRETRTPHRDDVGGKHGWHIGGCWESSASITKHDEKLTCSFQPRQFARPTADVLLCPCREFKSLSP